MVTASKIMGRSAVGVIVWTPEPGMSKAIVSSPAEPAGASPEAAFVLAAVIASRKVTTPSTAIVSPVPVTVIVLAEAVDPAKNKRPISITMALIVVAKR